MNNESQIDLSTYDWGPTDERTKELLTLEFADYKIYNIHHEVNEGDIVLDIGASTGIWTYSILHKNPKFVLCVEPSKTEFPCLVKNTMGHPVTHLNKAVTKGNGTTDEIQSYYYNGPVETITFKSLVDLYGLRRINFLKTDCEGGEYAIFLPENFPFLLNNVDVIVGEFHLEFPEQNVLFRQFRDNFLAHHPNFRVHAVDGTDIMWDLWNEHFLEYYKQVIVHIDNRNL